MTTPLCAILADDLTGACDAAAPFAAAGNRAWVTWRPESLAEPDAVVLSLSSDSRAEAAEAAAERVRSAAGRIRAINPQFVFKKIDSTLKGHWALEMRVTMEELRRPVAIVAPAFPAMHRRVIDGRLISRDTAPETSPSLLEALRERCGELLHVSLEDLRRGPEHLGRLMERDSAAQVVVADSEVDSDLDVIAAVIESATEHVLPVGSAGLAAAIARRASRSSKVSLVSTAHSRRAIGSEHGQSVVVFAGSRNPITNAQLESLRREGRTIEVLPGQTAGVDVARALAGGKNVIVCVEWSAWENDGLDQIIGYCQESPVAGVVLTGGDTAQRICALSDARGTWIDGEFEPGIPWGRLSGGRLDGQLVVTKAGGFGDEDLIVRIGEFLRRSVHHGSQPASARAGA